MPTPLRPARLAAVFAAALLIAGALGAHGVGAGERTGERAPMRLAQDRPAQDRPTPERSEPERPGQERSAPERASSERAVAIAAQVTAEAQRTRLALVLSRPVEVRTFLMEEPDRVIVDLPEVNFQLPAEAGRRREGLVASYRYGLFAPGRSRLVVDLAGPALIGRVETTTRPVDGATVLSIEFVRGDREAFRRAAAAPPPDRPTLRPTTAEAGDHRPLIVVDAGHGGIDPGAIAASGVFEKDIVFGFATRLADRLRASGRYRVAMTRERDVFVALGERVRAAREARADLFISIHADSIASAPRVRGTTVYTGAERATDAEAAKLAERENHADAAAGAEAGEGPTEVLDILQDLTHRETRGFSNRFAQRLIGQLGPVVEFSPKPQREAGFRVLRSPDVPSVLVELGYLSSPQDLDLLTSDAWGDRVSGAMTSAVDQFFAKRLAARGGPEGVGPAAVSP